MLGMEQHPDDLQAAIAGDKVFIRVTGRGSFKVSATLKQFIAEITSKQPVSAVVLDLSECIGMDSTFMGVLAGLSMRLQKVAEGRVVLGDALVYARERKPQAIIRSATS